MKDLDELPLDEQFLILLHKKIMNKTGGAKRRAKKYYCDQYRKTGVIPKPLLLADSGIMDGRRCSGRRKVLSRQIEKRFVEMVRASCDLSDERFIFVTRNCRTIKNYHVWLQEEFNCKISIAALRRYARQEKLQSYLDKPDFDEEPDTVSCFKDEPVFDLIQVDGCSLHYIKIRFEKNTWLKPQVIEFYDTGSRFMFVLDAYFSESNLNSIDIFSQFLLSTPLPNKKIRLRPDNAKGFLNLKRPINELNITYSVPNGFYLQPDFSRFQSPKDKVHLESSHRSLHNFEMRIIKHFEDRIHKTEPGHLFRKNKKEKITITYLDIDLECLRNSGLLESYRLEHNEQKHYFSVDGKIFPWVPAEKLDAGITQNQMIRLVPEKIRHLMKYGFDKNKATVSKNGIIIFKNQTYYVAVGRENFSRHKSTRVKISCLTDKLFIFENKEDGIFLGEALRREPFLKSNQHPIVESNEVELIAEYLERQKMTADRIRLVELHYRGLSLSVAQSIYCENEERYRNYTVKLRQPAQITGKALFNAFILDCERQLTQKTVILYAAAREVDG